MNQLWNLSITKPGYERQVLGKHTAECNFRRHSLQCGHPWRTYFYRTRQKSTSYCIHQVLPKNLKMQLYHTSYVFFLSHICSTYEGRFTGHMPVGTMLRSNSYEQWNHVLVRSSFSSKARFLSLNCHLVIGCRYGVGDSVGLAVQRFN